MERRPEPTVATANWTLRELSTDDPVLTFARAVASALDGVPRRFEPRWLYDARGSGLYEAITQMAEYPLYRAEDGLLRAHADELAQRLGAVDIVELGAASATKTRRLLDAFVPLGTRHYTAIDVSRSALVSGCTALASRYPGLSIEGFVGTYEEGLAQHCSERPKLMLFLGSTLGNHTRDQTAQFFSVLREALAPGDHVLLGIDGIKPVERLLRAYDDPWGLTEAFILNLFVRMNRELGTRIPIDRLRLVTRWEAVDEQIAMYARFDRACLVEVPLLDRSWRIEAGEEVLVEISRKFRADRLAARARRLGFELRWQVADPEQAYLLLLLERTEGA